jgi:hypothetical protein
MLKVNDKISLSSQSDMDKLGKARKAGKWVVTNRNRTIVKFIGSESEAKKFFSQQRVKRGGAQLLGALVTVKISKADQQRYHEIQKAIVAGW